MERDFKPAMELVIAVYIRLSAEDGDLSDEKMRATVWSTSGHTSISISHSTPNFQERGFWNFVMMAILERTWSAPQSSAFCGRSGIGKSTASSSRICPVLGVTTSW